MSSFSIIDDTDSVEPDSEAIELFSEFNALLKQDIDTSTWFRQIVGMFLFSASKQFSKL